MVTPHEIPRPSVLVSNSTLYFASRLLEGTLPVNAMTVFNLATFCEAIALGEVIYKTTDLAIVIAAMLAGIYAFYLLRRQRRRVILGVAGSFFMLGLVTLATLAGLISGWLAWILVILLLITFVGSSYSALKTQAGNHGSPAKASGG